MKNVQQLQDRIAAAAGVLASEGPNAALAAIRETLKNGAVTGGAGLGHGVGTSDMPGVSALFNAGKAASFSHMADSAFGTKASTFRQPEFVSALLNQLGVHVAGSGASTDAAGTHTAPAKANDREDDAGAAADGKGRFISKTFTNHAGTRRYKLYIPGSYTGQAMPLMVMLHGCTQNPDDFSAGTQMNRVAEEKHCFVVYPAQEQSANASKCWNWFKAIDQQRGQGEPSMIAGITETVIADYGLDRDKVYVAGLSAGGAMAAIMGTTYPDVYKAVGVHSGLPYAAATDLPSAMQAMRGVAARRARFAGGSSQHAPAAVPVIVFHGDRDTTVNAANGDRLMEDFVGGFAKKEHATAMQVLVEDGGKPGQRTYTRTSHHAGDGHAVAEHWVIHGAGHAWAGGSADGSYTDGSGPDASREMLRFFYTQAPDTSDMPDTSAGNLPMPQQ